MPAPADNLNQWTPPRNRIDGLLAELARQVDPALADTPRGPTLHALLVALRRFGANQLDFFLKGFGPNGGLDPHHLYSPTYALDVTVNQIGYDLDLLLRASHQRTLWPSLLAGADQVAMAALQPAIQHDLTRPATVLTYLQKSPSIRLTPYAPVALVALPYGATGRVQEMATVIHEVGHYVADRWKEAQPDDNTLYRLRIARHGAIYGLRQLLGAIGPAEMSDLWLDGWRDEIFADVYTCIVGGPKTGATLLDLLRGLPATRWLDDDGEHPLPILRPAIYAATLRQMATIVGPDTDVACDLCNAAAQLDATASAWQMQLPDWVTFASRRGPRIDLGAARAFIAEEVKTLLQDGLKPLCPTNGAAGELWPLLEAAAVLATLDLGAAAPELVATDQSQIGWADSAAPWQAGSTGLGDIPWEQARDELLANAPGDKAAELATEGWDPWWLGVLSAGAWTTEGPGPGNPMPGG